MNNILPTPPPLSIQITLKFNHPCDLFYSRFHTYVLLFLLFCLCLVVCINRCFVELHKVYWQLHRFTCPVSKFCFEDVSSLISCGHCTRQWMLFSKIVSINQIVKYDLLQLKKIVVVAWAQPGKWTPPQTKYIFQENNSMIWKLKLHCNFLDWVHE